MDSECDAKLMKYISRLPSFGAKRRRVSVSEKTMGGLESRNMSGASWLPKYSEPSRLSA